MFLNQYSVYYSLSKMINLQGKGFVLLHLTGFHLHQPPTQIQPPDTQQTINFSLTTHSCDNIKKQEPYRLTRSSKFPVQATEAVMLSGYTT